MALWPTKKPTLAVSSNPFGVSAQDINTYAAMARHQMQQMQQMQQMMRQGSGLSRAVGSAQGQPQAIQPSRNYPNTLGFRAWTWDMTTNELRSPVHGTTWNGVELRCERWDEASVVRGVAGIHAYLVPDNWHKHALSEAANAGRAHAEYRDGGFRAVVAVQGLVERFGKFVLGTDGWRAEWVMIRKLAAPTEQIGMALEAAFPDVEIIYGNR